MERRCDESLLKKAAIAFAYRYHIDEFCPHCGSDDYDVIKDGVKKCYNCSLETSIEDWEQTMGSKFLMMMTDIALSEKRS